MADRTSIEWTDETWNPTTGCDRVSNGCDRCYAATMAKRLKAMGVAEYQRDGDPPTSGPGFGVALHPHRLDQPLRWKRPRRIFVNSMSDLFHGDVPDDYIARVFAVMALAPQHTFQVLTKRHARMRSLVRDGALAEAVWDDLPNDVPPVWPLPNVWLGVSVEDQKRADLRIPALLDTPAAVRFLSCEPLLGPVDLDQPRCDAHDRREVTVVDGREWCGYCAADGFSGELSFGHWLDPLNGGIDWVIAGGESGRGARPMHPDWARQLRDQCVAAGVPFLFKQWGEHVTEDQSPDDIVLPSQRWHLLGNSGPGFYRVGKKAAGRELDGRTWDEYPQTEAVAT